MNGDLCLKTPVSGSHVCLFVLSIFLLDFGHNLSLCLAGYYCSPDIVYYNHQEILYDAIWLQRESSYALGRQLG